MPVNILKCCYLILINIAFKVTAYICVWLCLFGIGKWFYYIWVNSIVICRQITLKNVLKVTKSLFILSTKPFHTNLWLIFESLIFVP